MAAKSRPVAAKGGSRGGTGATHHTPSYHTTSHTAIPHHTASQHHTPSSHPESSRQHYPPPANPESSRPHYPPSSQSEKVGAHDPSGHSIKPKSSQVFLRGVPWKGTNVNIFWLSDSICLLSSIVSNANFLVSYGKPVILLTLYFIPYL